MHALVPGFCGGTGGLNSSSYVCSRHFTSEAIPRLLSDWSFYVTFQRHWVIKKEVFVAILFYSWVEFYWKLTQIQEERSTRVSDATGKTHFLCSVDEPVCVCEGTVLETWVMRSKCRNEDKSLHSQHVCLCKYLYFNNLPLFMADIWNSYKCKIY
jgi:hypothetical protein